LIPLSAAIFFDQYTTFESSRKVHYETEYSSLNLQGTKILESEIILPGLKISMHNLLRQPKNILATLGKLHSKIFAQLGDSF
jgi:hypothetical protein